MSVTWFNGLPGWNLPGWAVSLGLAAHLAAGIGLGACYFGGLWWNACLFASRTRLAAAIGLMVGRIALLAGCLTLASLEGALPLLMMALGVVAARPLVLRGIKATAP